MRRSDVVTVRASVNVPAEPVASRNSPKPSLEVSVTVARSSGADVLASTTEPLIVPAAGVGTGCCVGDKAKMSKLETTSIERDRG
jgi:hypothetical protein